MCVVRRSNSGAGAFLGLESIAICGGAESWLDGMALQKHGARMHAAQCEGHAGHIPAPLHGRGGGAACAVARGSGRRAAHRGDAGFAGLIVESSVVATKTQKLYNSFGISL